MVKKTAVEIVVVQGCNATIRAAVVAYFGAEKKCFAAWGEFFGTMDKTAQGVAYKNLLEVVRTVDGEVLPKAKCSTSVMLEYHKIATSKSRYMTSLRKKASKEQSTWPSAMHELAGKKVKFLQAMKPERALGRSINRLVAAWQVVSELTK